MSHKVPPVPPENRSSKGPGSDPNTKRDDVLKSRGVNINEQDRYGNIKQNTTNQGYQQDR